jgi:hypothetical protein
MLIKCAVFLMAIVASVSVAAFFGGIFLTLAMPYSEVWWTGRLAFYAMVAGVPAFMFVGKFS